MCSYPCTLPPSFLYSRQPRHGSLSSENASRRTVWLGDPTLPLKWPHRRVPDYFPVYLWKSDPGSLLDIKSRFSVSFSSLCLNQVSWKHIHWLLAWPQKTWKMDSIYFLRLIPILTHNSWKPAMAFTCAQESTICNPAGTMPAVHSSQSAHTCEHRCQQILALASASQALMGFQVYC